MADIIIVHGILTHGGGIDKFGRALEKEGFNVRYFDYPKRFPLMLYLPWIYRGDGKRLRNFANPGDHVIAHSYGCAVWQQSIKVGARWGKCFLFAGACTSNRMDYPEGCMERTVVVYNPLDKALWWGAWLPFHIFGKMGLHGYTSSPARKERDDRFELKNGFSYKSARLPLWRRWFLLNHSHYWTTQKEKWLSFFKKEMG